MEVNILNNWCKLFTLENGAQVLMTKDYDSQEEKHLIRIETRFQNDGIFVSPSLNYNYDDEDKRDRIFETTNALVIVSSFTVLHNQILDILEY